MGRLTVNGIDALSDDFAALARLPDSVIEGMLNAEADIIVAEQQHQVGTQWQGKYSEKISAKSIKKGKVKKTKDGYYITIFPKGTRKRGGQTTRNAEIAFINEYGARAAHSRPPRDRRREQEERERGDRRRRAGL